MSAVIRPGEGGEREAPAGTPPPRNHTGGRVYGAAPNHLPADPQAPGPQIPGPQIPGPQIPGPQIFGPQAAGPQAAGPRGTAAPVVGVQPVAARPGGVYQSAATHSASSGTPAPDRPRRRGPIVAILSIVLLLALVGGGATVQFVRSLPAPTLTLTAPAMIGTGAAAAPKVAQVGQNEAVSVRIPGTPVKMPWPKTGQAGLIIEGIGSLGSSGGSAPAPIGSVAKVMTAYVVLSGHPLEGDAEGPTLTVTEADVADYRSRIPSGQSLVAMEVGERLTQRDAIEALMLPSANNVAHLLAVWDAGSQEAFVAKMNDVVTRLKLTGSHYTDPSGFEPTTVSTAADQIVLAREVLKLPGFAEIVAQRTATVPVAGTVRNYNDLLGVDGVFGIKTGSTDEAGGNLLFAAHLTVAGRELTLIGAVFNQPGTNTPQQLAKVNTVVRKLLTAAERAVRQRTLLPADPVGQVRTAWGDTVNARPSGPLKVIGWPGLAVPVTTTLGAVGDKVTAGQVLASVEARQSIGTARVDVVAETSTSEPSLWWRLTRKP